MKIFFKVVAISSLMIGGFASVSFAYVPPSEFVLKKWTEKSKAVNSLKIVRKISIVGKPFQFKEELRADFKTGVIISRALDVNGQELYVELLKNLDRRAGPEAALYFQHQFAVVSQLMASLKIPIKTEAEVRALKSAGKPIDLGVLKRWSGKIYWVFESPETGDARSSIWIEKDSFVPGRVIIGKGVTADPDIKEIQFNQLAFYKDLYLPKQVIFSRGLTQLQADLLEVRVNETGRLGEVVRSGWISGAETTVSPELKSAIEHYYEAFL